MKFNIDDKAIEYLNSKNIKSIYIDTITQKAGCCGNLQVMFDIRKDKTPNKNYLNEKVSGIDVNYDSTMKFYFKNNEEPIRISRSGVGFFSRIYVDNEVNVFSDK